MHTTKLVDDLAPGDLVWVMGYLYRVIRNRYDPFGNSGNSPRYCYTGNAIKSPHGTLPPDGYREECNFGASVGTMVTIEV